MTHDRSLTRCDGCHRGFSLDDLQVKTNTDTGESIYLCVTCDPPPVAKRGPTKRPGSTTLGPSRNITIRIPIKLLHRIERIAGALFQPTPVVIRAALAEYAERHRPKPGLSSGMSIVWKGDDAPVSEE